MKKIYTAPSLVIYNVYVEDQLLNASNSIKVDNTQTGEAGNSYSLDKSEIWDTNWDEE